MDNKELLKNAAKAAGIPRHDCDPITNIWYVGTSVAWKPLTDDGDALRLAVKLGIDIQFHGKEVLASTLEVLAKEQVNNDPYAATRRAIVGAAAEIGKDMQECAAAIRARGQ